MFQLAAPRQGWAVLAQGRRARQVARGQILYLEGEPGRHFYYLQQGRVCIYLSSGEGLEKTLAVREAGEIFGEAAFLDNEPRMSSARALTDCRVVSIGRAELEALFRRQPSLALEMLQSLSHTVRLLSAQVDTIAFLPADRRLAGVLLSQQDRQGCVAATQEELGSLAAVSRVTVNRILQGFARRGWVQLAYRQVKLLCPDALQSFAAD